MELCFGHQVFAIAMAANGPIVLSHALHPQQCSMKKD